MGELACVRDRYLHPALGVAAPKWQAPLPLTHPGALTHLPHPQVLGEASLPPEYGGTAQAVPVQEAARLWDAQQQNMVEGVPPTAAAAAATEGSAPEPAPDAPGLEGGPSPQA